MRLEIYFAEVIHQNQEVVASHELAPPLLGQLQHYFQLIQLLVKARFAQLS